MKTLFWRGMARLIFAFTPLSLVVFSATYLTCLVLAAHGYRGLLFIPGTAAIGVEIWLYNALLSPLLEQMAVVKASNKRVVG